MIKVDLNFVLPVEIPDEYSYLFDDYDNFSDNDPEFEKVFDLLVVKSLSKQDKIAFGRDIASTIYRGNPTFIQERIKYSFPRNAHISSDSSLTFENWNQ
jgi:hypothetical protein